MFKTVFTLALTWAFFGAATSHAADETHCLMADRQQQSLVLADGPKALNAENTSECFTNLVRDEMAVLKDGDSPLAEDRDSVIQSLMHSALERYSFDKTQAE